MTVPPPLSPHRLAASRAAAPGHGALAVALAGMASLAAAMGIGRFAFTPLLPLMLQGGALTLAGGSWLATANYLGYLAGALVCMALPWQARRRGRHWPAARMARWGLVATTVLTLAMALPAAPAWPTLRFLAGLVEAESGRPANARALWQALLTDTPADAPWRAMLERRLNALP